MQELLQKAISIAYNSHKNQYNVNGEPYILHPLRIMLKAKNVIIDISDNGKGIKSSQLKTVFEPGYTTKLRGWGLGLSLVKRIVEDYHKGQVYILHSELGKGSTFRISLLKS